MGNIVHEQNFSAWGLYRDPNTWAFTNTTSSTVLPWFNRGYTSHEYHAAFGLLNMNASMYDPTTGRVISPDPYVVDPHHTQAYNRFSYCLNNPMKYTDPDGEWVHLAIGAAIGGIGGAIVGINNGATEWKLAAYIAIGAGAGALSAGVGAGVNAAIAGKAAGGGFMAGFAGTATATIKGFVAGFATGAAAGATNGVITGTGYGMMGGQNFNKAFVNGGLNQAWKQGLIGGVTGGVFGGIAATSDGRDFWTGIKPLYESKLNGYELVWQDGKMNCKNATLESIEKMNGGLRDQKKFREIGNEFLEKNSNANLEDYFENAGFRVEDPSSWNYKQISRGMELGNPTVINQNAGIDHGHTLTIIKIRQWKPNGNVKVWFSDPQKGIWKGSWNSTVGSPFFNKGAYLFWIR